MAWRAPGTRLALAPHPLDHSLACHHLSHHPPILSTSPLPALEPWLRACVPVAQCPAAPPPPPGAPLPCLALVATSPLSAGVELLLNYRLSPRLARPDWYVPVDGEEEERRWA